MDEICIIVVQYSDKYFCLVQVITLHNVTHEEFSKQGKQEVLEPHWQSYMTDGLLAAFHVLGCAS